MGKIILHRTVAAPSVTAGNDRSFSGTTIKLGLDIHAACYVVAVQEDHATPKPARRFAPGDFVPWVEALLAKGHRVFVVYEACGFGFGLCRRLEALGAACYVIAPRKLDEARQGVKTDALDAGVLCQRLSRYVEGNKKELAVLRIPTEEEEQLRHIHRQREALVRARTKLQAQGRGLLVTHGQPAPPRWWRKQGWSALEKILPAWLLARLEVFQPVLEVLDGQIAALTAELEKAAAPELPAGLGKLTSVVVSREVCDWQRFKNRRQVSSYTGLCPGEYSSGGKRVPGSVTKHGNPRLRSALVELAWRLVRFQPGYPPVRKRLTVLAPGARATGAARKKAIVRSPISLPPLVPCAAASAVARQLAVDLWRWQSGRCTAEQIGLGNQPLNPPTPTNQATD